MIVGVGTDILEISRLNSLLANEKFLKRVYTESELGFAKEKKRKTEIFAGTFSSKEAVSKALGTGFRDFNLKDIEILRDQLGKPYVRLHNEAKKVSDGLGIKNIFISISHTDSHCMAFCVAEG